MLTIIIGGTSDERLNARRKVAGDVPVQEIEGDRVNADELASIAGTPALFGGAQAFLLRGVLSTSKTPTVDDTEQESTTGEVDGPDDAGTARDALLALAQGLVASSHLFIFEEEKLLAPAKNKLTKAGAELVAFEKSIGKKETFNVFALADAMGRGDKKMLWLLLTRALREGVAPENIVGILAWKARTMLAGARNPTERARLNTLSRDLVVMYHDAHRGAGDLGLLLEQWVLRG